MSSLAQAFYTPEQYLDLERKAEHKSEYVNGQIFAMSGASKKHNRIALNVSGRLDLKLGDGPCEVFVSDVRVKVSNTGMYTYPDVVGACGSIFEDDHVDTLVNPVFIVEVLSPSTEAYDRGEKFAHYRRLETLQEYVLIAQDKIRVEYYVRRDNGSQQWVLTELSNLDDILHLSSIGCELVLREVYARIKFS